LNTYGLHLLVEIVLRYMLLVQTLVCVLDSLELWSLARVRLVERVVPGVPLRLQDLTGSSWDGLRGSLVGSVSVGLQEVGVVIDIININAVDTVVEVADVQSQVVVVHQLHIVDLLVDILIPTIILLHFILRFGVIGGLAS
jgi:hypothetical protein